MKKVIMPLIIAIMIFGIAIAPADSKVYASAPLPPFESAIQVQNLDEGAAASIAITYYNPDGSLASLPAPYTNPVNDTVPAGSSKTYLPIHPSVGFKGSAVVSSGSPIAIISNLTIAATQRALGTYVGATGGGNNLYFPLIDKRSNVSVFSIQNTGNATANIVINFVPLPGGGYASIPSVNDSIAAGAAKTYYMADYNGSNPWLGSIKVTSTGSTITGVVSNVNFTNATSPTNGVYNGFNSGSTSVVLPLVMEANSGNRTGTSCQNLGPSTATITMNYFPEAGFPARAPDVFTNIPVNGIAVKVFNETGTRWVGSSTVTVSGSNTIVCVVNQTRPSLRRSNLYEGFNPSALTDTVVLPLVMSKNGSTTKTFTGFSIASADGSNITVTCDWKPGPGFPDIANTVKGPAPVVVFSQQTGFSAGDAAWIGSAKCTAAAGKKIAAVVNQSREFLPTGTLRDVTSAYNGFNQ